MTENNAAQPGLKDAVNILRALRGYLKSHRINGPTMLCTDGKALNNTDDEVLRALEILVPLSKLRAEGVQAGDEESSPTAPDDEAILDAWITASDIDGIAYDGPSFERGYRAALAGAPVADLTGWRMVPTEPTPEMLKAWHDTYSKAVVKVGRSGRAYAAMLEAAPRASAPVAMIDTAKLAQLLDSVNGDCYLGKEKEEELAQFLRSQLRAPVAGEAQEPIGFVDPVYVAGRQRGMKWNAKIYNAPSQEASAPLYAAPQASEADDLIGALGQCRDAFPIPATAGSPLDLLWQEAMSDPAAVPAYVKACASNGQASEAVDESPNLQGIPVDRSRDLQRRRGCATCRGTGEVANLPSWPSLQVCGNGPTWKKCPDCGDRAKAVDDSSDSWDGARKRVPKASEAVRLDAPAQVGNARFGKGVQWSTVIAAAQRHHAFMNTPEKEAERIARSKEFVESIQPNKDGGDCAKGGGEVGADSLESRASAYGTVVLPPLPTPPEHKRHAMYAGSQMMVYARDAVLADRQQRPALPTPSVVKQSLTATQTGEKGESDE